MNFANLKTYSINNPIGYPFHPDLQITIDIIENKICIGGTEVESSGEKFYEMCEAVCNLHINNLNFEYFAA